MNRQGADLDRIHWVSIMSHSKVGYREEFTWKESGIQFTFYNHHPDFNL